MGLNNLFEHLLAGRWIAGEKINDAIKEAEKFNNVGIKAIINYLGEEFTSKKEVDSTISTYFKLIDKIRLKKIIADISVKPTQLGLIISKSFFKNSFEKIMEYARKNNVFMWVDMEDKNTVGETLNTYSSELTKARGEIGICIQAYLKRSYADIKKIVPRGAIIRLVKGAYSLSDETYRTQEEISKNYQKLMLYLFNHSKEFTVATHDLHLVEKALKLNIQYKRNVTYAMLKGVRNRYLKKLYQKGNNTAVYVPFGEKWLDYSYRRLKEAGHLSIIIKSMFERQGV